MFGIALLLCCASAQADEPPAARDQQAVLYLGKIQVSGYEKVVATLRAIKLALKTPFSTDAAHADQVVCRINKRLGETREYLDCASNRNYTARRDVSQLAAMGAQNDSNIFGAGMIIALNELISAQPNHQLHVPVNGAALQNLVEQIPDAPAATTQPSPAAATMPRPPLR